MWTCGRFLKCLAASGANEGVSPCLLHRELYELPLSILIPCAGTQATQKRALTPRASKVPTTATTLLERLRRGLPVQYNRALGVFSLPGPWSMADVVHASRDQAWGAGSGPGKVMPVEFTSRWEGVLV